MQRLMAFDMTLGRLVKCPKLEVVDACHSGTPQTGGPGPCSTVLTQQAGLHGTSRKQYADELEPAMFMIWKNL